MRNVRKKPPSIKLVNLLRRRGLSLDSWMTSAGVSSYVEIVRWCTKIGVLPPDEETYKALRPDPVSSPSDGIVVAVVEPSTALQVSQDPSPETFEWPVEVVQSTDSKKKSSRKKSETASA